MTEAAFLLAGVLTVLLVHEEGHYLAARILGYPARFRLRSVEWGSDAVLSPPTHRIIVAGAGPFASFAFFIECSALGWHNVALMTLLMTVFNLIPFPRSDGRNIIDALGEL